MLLPVPKLAGKGLILIVSYSVSNRTNLDLLLDILDQWCHHTLIIVQVLSYRYLKVPIDQRSHVKEALVFYLSCN